MDPKITQARNLFFQTELSQAEIARIMGINTKTLYRWIKQFEWRRIKAAARQAPAAIVERLYLQLLDLNNSICSRPEGSRIPTMEEAELNRKLIVSIGKLGKQVTRSEAIQVLTNYTSYISTQNIDDAHMATQYADKYLCGQFKDGFQPYELEYELNEPEDADIADTPAAEPASADEEQQPIGDTNRSNEGSSTETPVAQTPSPPAVPAVSGKSDDLPADYDPGITPQEYQKFKSLLDRPCNNIRQSMLFNGKIINQMAFEYNLRQMQLPPAQRHYLTEQQFLEQHGKR